MEQYVISGESALISIDLTNSDGDYIVPDDSVYSYKITDNKGNILQSEQDVTIESGGSGEDNLVLKDQVIIQTDEETNTKEESSLFATRYVIVTFNSSGRPYRVKKTYKISDELYYTANKQEVRDVFGVSESELPDESIDLNTTYFEIVSSLGEVFTNAILAEDLSNFRANRLLVLKTALKLFNSLKLRLVESESSGTNKYLRNLKYANLEELKAAIEDEIAALEENLTGASTALTENYTPFHLGTQSPDPITGEES